MHECAICGLVSTEAPCPACGDDEPNPIAEASQADPDMPHDSHLPFGLDSKPQPETANLPFGLEETPESGDSKTPVIDIESSPNKQNSNSIPFGLNESPSTDD